MDHPCNTLAVLCAFGGVMGFARKGSAVSLVMGLGVGSLYAYAGHLLRQNADGGIQAAIAASSLLFIGGLPRAIKVRKPVPIGLTLTGLAGASYYGYKYYQFYLQ